MVMASAAAVASSSREELETGIKAALNEDVTETDQAPALEEA